jgi:hypothetical protein
MYFSLLNRLIATVIVWILSLQSCRSSFRVDPEDLALKKSGKTSNDEQATDQDSVLDLHPSSHSDVPNSALPTTASAPLPSVTTSTVQVALPTQGESEETDTEFVARSAAARVVECSSVGYLTSLRALPFSVPAPVFGEKEWRQYFGEVGVEPSLPSNIGDILSSTCPFWPGKSVKDTHLLVLIPATVDGKPFSLNLLGELIQHPRGGGHSTQNRNYDSDLKQQFGNQWPVSSYWVLMTRDVLEGSRNETYASQQALVAHHTSRTGLPYELPGALEAVTAILSHYVHRGERLYSDSPWTYTRCRELVEWDGVDYPIIVGGFSSWGLDVGHDDDGDDFYDFGVAGLRRF